MARPSTLVKRRITQKINQFTNKEFGVTTKSDEIFQSFPRHKEITYTMFAEPYVTETFMENVNARYPELEGEVEVWLWLLLHEIGHCMTISMWTDAEIEMFMKWSDIADDGDNWGCSAIENTEFYYAIPWEFFATKWAGDYIKENSEKLETFWDDLYPLIADYYEKYSLENEEKSA